LIQQQYGFQRDNVRNQRENVLMLLGNILSGLPKEASDGNPEDDSWSHHTAEAGDLDSDEYSLRQIEHAVYVAHQMQLKSYRNWAKNMVGIR
jgi:hypothetical protein